MPTMMSSTRTQGRPELVYGLGMAAVIMTSFGFVWFGWGFGSLPYFAPWRWIVLCVAAIALLVPSVSRMRAGKKLIVQQGMDSDEFWKKKGKGFGLVSVGEFVGCGIVAAGSNWLHHPEFVAPGIGLVVGLHFLPLAKLFEMPVYYATGAAMVLADIAAALLGHGDAIGAASGIANGVILWTTAIYVLALSRR